LAQFVDHRANFLILRDAKNWESSRIDEHDSVQCRGIPVILNGIRKPYLGRWGRISSIPVNSYPWRSSKANWRSAKSDCRLACSIKACVSLA
jgi:hypothetical protein